MITFNGTITVGTERYATSLAEASDLYGDGYGESRNRSQRQPDSNRRMYETREAEHHHVPELPGGLSAYWLPKP